MEVGLSLFCYAFQVNRSAPVICHSFFLSARFPRDFSYKWQRRHIKLPQSWTLMRGREPEHLPGVH